MDKSDAKTGEGGANTTTRIEQAIVRVRGLNVMLDADLAALYGSAFGRSSRPRDHTCHTCARGSGYGS